MATAPPQIAVKPNPISAQDKRTAPRSWGKWLWRAGFLAVAATGVWYWASAGGPPIVEVATAEVRTIDAAFTAEGYVNGKEYRLAPESSGRLTEQWVQEGDKVRSGQLLLRIEDSEQEAMIREAAAAQTAAASGVMQAKSQLTATTREIEARISAARAGVRQAQASLAKIRAGARSQERAQGKERVARARIASEQADRDLQRAKFLYEEGAIPRAQFEAASSAADSARTALNEAEAALSLLEQGPSTEDLALGRRAVESANAELEVALSARGQLAAYRDAIATAEAAQRQTEAALTRARIARTRTELRAPVDGIVSKVVFERGAMLAAGVPALTISTRHDLHIEAEISSEDAGKIRQGMPVSVTSPAYPGRTFEATLVSALPVGELKPDAAIRTRIIRARIMLASGWDLFKPGMEVDVEATTTLRQELCVPSDAINLTGSKSTVFVLDKGLVREVAVKTGFSNPEVTEILSGLKGGEKVVVSGKDGLANGSKVKVKGSGAES